MPSSISNFHFQCGDSLKHVKHIRAFNAKTFGIEWKMRGNQFSSTFFSLFLLAFCASAWIFACTFDPLHDIEAHHDFHNQYTITKSMENQKCANGTGFSFYSDLFNRSIENELDDNFLLFVQLDSCSYHVAACTHIFVQKFHLIEVLLLLISKQYYLLHYLIDVEFEFNAI